MFVPYYKDGFFVVVVLLLMFPNSRKESLNSSALRGPLRLLACRQGCLAEIGLAPVVRFRGLDQTPGCILGTSTSPGVGKQNVSIKTHVPCCLVPTASLSSPK